MELLIPFYLLMMNDDDNDSYEQLIAKEKKKRQTERCKEMVKRKRYTIAFK